MTAHVVATPNAAAREAAVVGELSCASRCPDQGEEVPPGR